MADSCQDRARTERFPALPRPSWTAMMDPNAMPFDGKRMIYGGFSVVVDAELAAA